MLRKTILLFSMVGVLSFGTVACSKSETASVNKETSPTSVATESTAKTDSTSTNTVTTKAAVETTSASEKIFTLEELKKYNGKNGNPSYVAIKGKVYDVSKSIVWKLGEHEGYNAGEDITEPLKKSPHGESVLKGLPIVGKLVMG